jgi:hypothetical protein
MAGDEATTGADITLDDAWVERLTAASAQLGTGPIPSAGRSVVEFSIGKKQKVAVTMTDGLVTGRADDEAEPDVSIPTTAAQLGAFCDGSESMARAYMQGDVKPAGSTGALLPVIGLFESPEFRAGL